MVLHKLSTENQDHGKLYASLLALVNETLSDRLKLSYQDDSDLKIIIFLN